MLVYFLAVGQNLFQPLESTFIVICEQSNLNPQAIRKVSKIGCHASKGIKGCGCLLKTIKQAHVHPRARAHTRRHSQNQKWSDWPSLMAWGWPFKLRLVVTSLVVCSVSICFYNDTITQTL